ncbi:MAG: DUF1573 domain-containing protein [Alistipes sp.]|jgi:hypothetical protein|nr:DUF1573 domain-containing protein [Alistipes sp.]
MKKFLLILALSIINCQLSIVAAQNSQPQGPHFAFASTEFDFGEVLHSLPRIEHRFAFTNDGTAPLVVTRTLTSCSCVKVEYPKRPIPPGGSGEIVVVYEVNKKESGVFYKVIEIYSNAPERRTNLIVKGNAIE